MTDTTCLQSSSLKVEVSLQQRGARSVCYTSWIRYQLIWMASRTLLGLDIQAISLHMMAFFTFAGFAAQCRWIISSSEKVCALPELSLSRVGKFADPRDFTSEGEIIWFTSSAILWSSGSSNLISVWWYMGVEAEWDNNSGREFDSIPGCSVHMKHWLCPSVGLCKLQLFLTCWNMLPSCFLIPLMLLLLLSFKDPVRT